MAAELLYEREFIIREIRCVLLLSHPNDKPPTNALVQAFSATFFPALLITPDLNSLVEFVLRGFKGAYGVIYEYDEQNEVLEGRGVFSVKVIKRGSCETRLDPFLSPAIPTVEDPCD